MSRKNHPYRGYAYTWADGYQTSDKVAGPALLTKGAVSFGNCKLCCHHDQRYTFGGVKDQLLEVWEDDTGIAVAFTLPDNPPAWLLHSGIVSRQVNGLSFMLHNSRSDVEGVDGEEVEIISKAQAVEVSILAEPDCVAARCWHREAVYWDQPKGIQTLMDGWNIGAAVSTRSPARAVSSFPAFAASAGRFTGVVPRQPFQKQRPPRALLDKIDAILAAAGR